MKKSEKPGHRRGRRSGSIAAGHSITEARAGACAAHGDGCWVPIGGVSRCSAPPRPQADTSQPRAALPSAATAARSHFELAAARGRGYGPKRSFRGCGDKQEQGRGGSGMGWGEETQQSGAGGRGGDLRAHPTPGRGWNPAGNRGARGTPRFGHPRLPIAIGDAARAGRAAGARPGTRQPAAAPGLKPRRLLRRRRCQWGRRAELRSSSALQLDGHERGCFQRECEL